MMAESNYPALQSFENSLEVGLSISELIYSAESKEYEAASFMLNSKTIIFRAAKITPKKIGQFVTIWKRNPEGITAPFSETDKIDFMIIAIEHSEGWGFFVFPKAVLIKQGIISTTRKEGKRGIRVYSPFDAVTSKQALKTQSWQIQYFLEDRTGLEQLN